VAGGKDISIYRTIDVVKSLSFLLSSKQHIL